MMNNIDRVYLLFNPWIFMRQVWVVLLFFAWSYTTVASDTSLIFMQLAPDEVFEMARKENKAVMLYFHFDGCGACLTMEQTTFKDQQVMDFLHANCIMMEINTKKGRGVEWNIPYRVTLHPTFLFFDSEGRELHKMVGVFPPEVFYVQAQQALLSDKNANRYHRLYQSGFREPDFLWEFTYMLRDAHELNSVVVHDYLDLLQEEDYVLEKNLKYIYEFCIHHFNPYIPYNSPAGQFLCNNKVRFYPYVDSQQVKTRIVWMLLSAIHKAMEEKDETTFRHIMDRLKEYDHGEPYYFKEMDGRVTGMTTPYLMFHLWLHFYEAMGDTFNYNKTLESYLTSIWHDAEELNRFAWGVVEQTQEQEMATILTAIRCSIRSIELDNRYSYNDTYAWLLYKAGKKKKALKQAKKTVAIAQKSNEDYRETQQLIVLISKMK
jgi:thioredoxin-related protein